MLLEKDKLLSKQTDVAVILNKHFGSITDSLNLFSWSENTSVSSGNDTINSISNRSNLLLAKLQVYGFSKNV